MLTQKNDRDEVFYTSCGQNGCFNNCVLGVHVEKGVITAIEPDDTIHQNMGREDEYAQGDIEEQIHQVRPCQRAYGWIDEVYAPDVVKYPMKRVGPKGAGAKFVRISWDEALTTVAEKMKEVKEKHGLGSILYFSMNTDWGLLNPWWGCGFLSWGNQSFGSNEEAQSWTVGHPRDLQVSIQNIDFLKSKLIVLWGWDPLTTYPEMAQYLILAKERGTQIIAVEPTYSWSVEVLADQWIPIRPGTDVSMILATANVLFMEDLIDKDFIARFIEPTGFEKWRNYVLGEEDGVEKTPEWAEDICGVPAETIREFARLYARSKPAVFAYHASCTRRLAGFNNARANVYIQAITGNMGIHGAWHGASGKSSPRFPLPMAALDFGSKLPEHQSLTLCNSNTWHRAILLRDKLDKGEITKQEFNEQIGNPNAAITPKIKMMLPCIGSRNWFVAGVYNHNWPMNLYDVNTRLEAVEKVEFIAWGGWHLDTTQNIMLQYADIILPLVNQFFQDYQFKVGMQATTMNWFIYQRKIVEPIGEQKSPVWIETRLAEKLGLADVVNTRLQNVPDDRWDEAIESIYREAYEKWAAMPAVRAALGNDPPSWDEFVKKPIIRVPVKQPYVAYEDQIHKGAKFLTQSGKIEFYNDYLARGPDHLAKHPYINRLYGRANIPPKLEYQMPSNGYLGSETKKHSLYLLTPHPYFRQHSCQDGNPLLNDEYRHACWMNVADAKTRGIKDGDLIRAYSDVGELILPAYVTSRIVPGCVIIRKGARYVPSKIKTKRMPYGIDLRGACNFLIKDDYRGLEVGDAINTDLIEVEKFMEVND